jgi:hypothetical protein
VLREQTCTPRQVVCLGKSVCLEEAYTQWRVKIEIVLRERAYNIHFLLEEVGSLFLGLGHIDTFEGCDYGGWESPFGCKPVVELGI